MSSRCAVQSSVTQDDVLGGIGVMCFDWTKNDFSAAHAFTNIVICDTRQTNGNSTNQECSQALPRGSRNLVLYEFLIEALNIETLGQKTGKSSADIAVGIIDCALIVKGFCF